MARMEGFGDTTQNAVSMPRIAAKRRAATRLGYVGLIDAAPYLVAEHFGLFKRKGLNVVLSREVGWATIREKVIFGELEGAHALSTLPFVSTLGLGAPQVPCLAAMVSSRGGNAVVLSEELRHRGVKSKESLKIDVDNRKAFRKYKLATVYSCSPHNFHLREWLRSAGIDPEVDVELVTLPPAQMCRNLAAGTIDGFCVGEPWASLAISQKIGWSPVNSEDLNPGHPEKVLMVRQDFADDQSEEHLAIIAALVQACALCEDASLHRQIASLLSDKKRVNCSLELIEKCLSPTFNYGLGKVEHRPNFLRFYANDSTRPTTSDTDWVLTRLEMSSSQKMDPVEFERASRVLREDLFEAAIGLVSL